MLNKFTSSYPADMHGMDPHEQTTVSRLIRLSEEQHRAACGPLSRTTDLALRRSKGRHFAASSSSLSLTWLNPLDLASLHECGAACGGAHLQSERLSFLGSYHAGDLSQ
jgi:hypothetical protein